ncbi:MAG: 4-(cytidine 5'-diphospho)-2-C-methyl-D-erythritol kinase [Clostridia bacterium]|nr:4-(cytidine 5'-diphospho)-2-C-methyl-D-erythritol kinase [Clostridia bacterium]
MNTVKIKAYAKVNLTLEIVGREGAYHLLDSLVASIDLFDLVVLKKRKDRLSSITMRGLGSEAIPPETNNALKAAEAFSEKFSCNGADITVFKNIPMGAGLGGSSADASGVLQGMAKLYGVTDEKGIKELADTLGSDTRYMLDGGFARMRGRGNDLEFLHIPARLHMLMICPPAGVSAGACYKKYDELPQTLEWREPATQNAIEYLKRNELEEVGRYLTNDLYKPAVHLSKEVETAMQEALSFSPIAACMTGSGSAVFALFETRELCDWAKSRYRGKFRAFVTRTVEPNGKKGFRSPYALSDEERALIEE